jgi:hypothetical protein
LRYKLSSLHITVGVSVYPLLFLIFVASLLGIYYSIGQTVQDELPEVLVSWYWLVSALVLPITLLERYMQHYLGSAVLAFLGTYVLLYIIFRFVEDRKTKMELLVMLLLLLLVCKIYFFS